jgi:hypothetical protein
VVASDALVQLKHLRLQRQDLIVQGVELCARCVVQVQEPPALAAYSVELDLDFLGALYYIP